MLKQLLRSLLMVALLALICGSFPAAQAAPGDLDTTFAGFTDDGIVSETGMFVYNSGYDTTNTMALQPDGKIVTAGRNGANQLIVFRYLPNGRRDPAFGGGDGRAVIPDPEGIELIPSDVTLQADGSIVVAGRTKLNGLDDNSDFLLVRLTASGELDPFFGDGGGIVTTNISGNPDNAFAVLIQPDGRIVACGVAQFGSGTSFSLNFAVARYQPDGAPDNSFSDDGKTTVEFTDNSAGCQNMALQSDGKLVLAGWMHDAGLFDSDRYFALARLGSNGSLDNSFDGNGKLTTDFGEYSEIARDVALQPDGKIVVLGESHNPDFPYAGHLARYLPNGALDGTFGSGGKLTIPGDPLSALALQPDGKLLALGYHPSSNVRDFAFHRLLPNGDPDPTFDEDGIRWQDFGGSQEFGTDLALLPDGRILGFGYNLGGTNSRLILVRLWPDGTTFDTGGRQTHSLSSGYHESAYALAVQPNGSFLVAGEGFIPLSSRSNAFVTRFHPDGRVDTGFGNLGTIYPPYLFSQPDFRGARAIAVQPDGKIVMAGYSDIGSNFSAEFLVARWHGNGAPDNSFGLGGFRPVGFPGNGDDYGTALALAPDGKIVVAGSVWDGTDNVWGVARLTTTGALDPSFGPNNDGLFYLNLTGGPDTAHAVLVQPDGKIVIAGHANNDFAIVRLLENGSRDPDFGANGLTITDLGGNSGIHALALAPNGWIYAAGYRVQNGTDMALAQYTPEGLLAVCPPGESCDYWPDHWPEGKRFVNLGGSDSAYALVLREDNQLVAAGCSGSHFAAAQVSASDVNTPPLLFQTDFVGGSDCAYGIQFSNADKNKFILAGSQFYDSDKNIALARFETTAANTPPPTPPPPSNGYPVYLPIVVR